MIKLLVAKQHWTDEAPICLGQVVLARHIKPISSPAADEEIVNELTLRYCRVPRRKICRDPVQCSSHLSRSAELQH
jgi:hypothetical protein